jgi:adenine-specific DNA-methyltransferase
MARQLFGSHRKKARKSVAQIRTARQLPLMVPVAPVEALEAGRIMSRALAVSACDSDRLKLVHSFGHRLLSAWWSALTAADADAQPVREPQQVFEQAELAETAQALADTIGMAASLLELQAAAYQISNSYNRTKI